MIPAPVEIAARGLRFDVRTAGEAGERVLLLHGFPETSAMWAPIMDALVGKGYRCAAPDQRGYSPGARPDGVEAYALDLLVGDVFGIADALGWDRFHLVAHDWGAAVAWLAAIADPLRIASLSVLSIPHYHAFAAATWSDPEEEPYRHFLELVLAPDGAAERVLSRNGFAGLCGTWTHHSAEETAATIAVLEQPGALSAMLAWYRASDGHRRILSRPPEPVAVPTLLLWGRDDPYVRPMAVALGEGVKTAGYRRIDFDSAHWLVQEKPTEVADAIVGQLKGNPISRTAP